jgi:DNA-binding NtrC family response regulator
MQMNVENREKDAANLRKKILLVDDDPAVRQILMRLLSDEGYLVVAAANATEAIYFSGLMMFDLLLIDVVPVAGTGWEMFQRLWLKNPRLAFIMITERSGRYFDSVASGLGVFLEKPLDFTKLFFTLRNLLDGPAEIRLARQLRTP